MALNPSIILQGSNPNLMAAYDGGQVAGARSNQIQQQNALAQTYKTDGAGIMSGNTDSLNRLAQIDAPLAMDFRSSQQTLKINEQNASLRAAELARTLDADTRAQASEQFGMGASMLTQAQTPEQFQAIVSRPGFAESAGVLGITPEMLTFENRDTLIASALGAAEAMKLGQPGGGAGLPSAVVELQFRAEKAGLQPGTPEYQSFMLNGGGDPATFRALDMQAQRAGFEPGTPEYEDFMATRGSGQQAFARTQGANEAEIASGGAAASAVESGKIAAERGAAAYDSYTKVVSSLSTIDEAIAAIDAGAQAGMTQKYLPNITLASASLENAMNRMGLDVISSVTFGALSEAEMNLAMDTAVPRDLSPPELKQWLTRKRDAQQKAADALLEAGRYLSKPGNTIESWIESKQGASGGAQPAQQGGTEVDFTQMSAADLAQVDVNSLTPAQMEAMMKRFDEVSQ